MKGIKISYNRELANTVHFLRSADLVSIVEHVGSKSDIIKENPKFRKFWKWWNGIHAKFSAECVKSRMKVEDDGSKVTFAA